VSRVRLGFAASLDRLDWIYRRLPCGESMGVKLLTVITTVGLGIIGLVIWVWHTGSGPSRPGTLVAWSAIQWGGARDDCRGLHGLRVRRLLTHGR